MSSKFRFSTCEDPKRNPLNCGIKEDSLVKRYLFDVLKKNQYPLKTFDLSNFDILLNI